MASYARVSGSKLERFWSDGATSDALLFVDVDLPADRISADLPRALGYVRESPLEPLAMIDKIVVRWPDHVGARIGAEAQEALDRMRRLIAGLGVAASPYFLLADPGGSPIVLKGDTDLEEIRGTEAESILVQSRSTEISALIHDGRAIWKPDGYHYRLPSGRHSESFVRVADAFRHPRDCRAIAWWLLEYAQDDVGVIADSTSLTPLVIAFQEWLSNLRLRSGPVWLSGEYPRSLRRVLDSAFEISAQQPSFTLGIQSVSSTGGTEDALREALGRTMEDGHWVLEVLVARSDDARPRRANATGKHVERVGTWCQLPGGSQEPDECMSCKSTTNSKLVHIDHESFATLALPEPDLRMPAIQFSDRSRGFWELCDQLGAILLDSLPDESVRDRRPHRRPMSVVVDFNSLLKRHRTFVNSPVGKLRRLAEAELGHINSFDWRREMDCVLLVAHETGRLEGKALASIKYLARGIFGSRTSFLVVDASVPIDAWSKELRTAVGSANNAAIFTVGLVTGSTVHQILAAIQKARQNKPGLNLHMVVLHARPDSERTWQNVLRPFGKRVQEIWISYLPEGDSPLAYERRLLETLDRTDVRNNARSFLDQRIAYTQNFDPSVPVLWGPINLGVDTWRLRPGSAYGEGLGPVAAFVAVGAAVQRSRTKLDQTARSAPTWEMFDMPSIVGSYYDAIITSSVIRWLQPNECWWGSNRETERGLANYLHEHSASEGEMSIVLSELLLAAAQGKVPLHGMELIRDRALAYVDVASPDQAAAVELGLELLE